SSTSPSQIARDAGMSATIAASVGRATEESGRGRFVLLVIGLFGILWFGRSLVRALKVVCQIAWHMEITTHATFLESASLAGFFVLLSAVPWAARPLYAGGLLTDLLAGAAMAALFGALGFWGMVLLPRPPGVTWLA